MTVKQQVVPLNTNRDLDLFGNAPIVGARRFQVALTLNGQAQSLSPLQDQFAPAQFFRMTDDEKIASPSFETMQAGFVIGSGDVSFDATAIVAASLDYDTLVVDALAQPAVASASSYTPGAGQVQAQLKVGSVARAAVRRIGRARFRAPGPPGAAGATFTPTRWAIVSQTDTSVLAPTTTTDFTWNETTVAASSLNRAGGQWQVVAAYEAGPR
jgi:hypothetical protein